MGNRDVAKDPRSKQEYANKVASRSKKMVENGGNTFLDFVMKIMKFFSDLIDSLVFQTRHPVVVSLALALLCYATVNFNNENGIFKNAIEYSRSIDSVSVRAQYNSETFEISGLPEKASITFIGDTTSVNAMANQEGYVVANLEGLTEGTHSVKLSVSGYTGNTRVKIEPTNATITLKKKTTRQFDLSYDYINLDKMDNIYSVSSPEFEQPKVNVRASKETLDSIAFVKALIDCSNVTADFSQEARLVAYDKTGMPVTADIVPETVTVNVKVTSPKKTVPISVEVTGEMAEDLAVDTITLDQETVTIYAAESILNQIDNVGVTIDAATLTADSTVVRPIVLPTGVNSASLSQVTINVKVSEAVTRTVENIPINYRNNNNNYKFTSENNVTTTSVDITGSKANVEKVNEADIVVFFDMTDAKPGLMEFQLSVEQIKNMPVKLSLKEATYSVNVIGETEEEEADEGGSEDIG
ncbi:MAG: hypothetical protein HUJ56_10890 [Erysipelotrichaceae bacterium]|nr:hypothetical protein [Erysipelotrichaceae bacterium]